jgi:hypothetical protein
MVQMPPQQSVPLLHTSPFWTQNEGWLQTPPTQNNEQHSEPFVHVFARILQAVVSGVHVPPVQVPLQQAALEPHAWLSEVHGVGWQTPPVQVPEQQSLMVAHTAPSARQVGPPSIPPVPVLELVLVPPPPPALAPVLLLPAPAPVDELDETELAPLPCELLVPP